jgi:hypothetical protein
VKPAPNPHPTKLLLRAVWRSIVDAELPRPSEHELMTMARKSGLIAAVHALNKRGEEDVRHVIKWALRGQDPWGKEFADGH